MSAKILFRRPFGDPSAILRRNPCNHLIPNYLQFQPLTPSQPTINQLNTPIPPINPTPPILPIPPIKPIHPISPICLVCCNFIAAKKPLCPGHQPCPHPSSLPPCTPAAFLPPPPPSYLRPRKKSFSNKYLTISLIQRLQKKIFNFRVTFSLFLQLIIIEGHPTHPQDRALHDNETKHKMKGQKMD